MHQHWSCCYYALANLQLLMILPSNNTNGTPPSQHRKMVPAHHNLPSPCVLLSYEHSAWFAGRMRFLITLQSCHNKARMNWVSASMSFFNLLFDASLLLSPVWFHTFVFFGLSFFPYISSLPRLYFYLFLPNSWYMYFLIFFWLE